MLVLAEAPRLALDEAPTLAAGVEALALAPTPAPPWTPRLTACAAGAPASNPTVTRAIVRLVLSIWLVLVPVETRGPTRAGERKFRPSDLGPMGLPPPPRAQERRQSKGA